MCSGPAEIVERKVAPDGSVNYYIHYMDCESLLPSHVGVRLCSPLPVVFRLVHKAMQETLLL